MILLIRDPLGSSPRKRDRREVSITAEVGENKKLDTVEGNKENRRVRFDLGSSGEPRNSLMSDLQADRFSGTNAKCGMDGDEFYLS